MFHLIRKIPRNVTLLITLLMLIVLSPSVPLDGSGIVFELLFDLILISGAYSVGASKLRLPFLAMTAVTLMVRWGEILSGVHALDVGALAITVLWLIFAVSIIVTHLFRRSEVTLDTILAAIVTYLLAAAAFTLIFQIIELQSPGSFSGLPASAASDHNELASVMMYFSLVCITTMGYGDIVPISDLARPLSVLEGVFGQIYLAVLVARLVGLHIAGGTRQKD